MTPMEFARRMGFSPATAEAFSRFWSDAPEMETLPVSFQPGFFDQNAGKLEVPTPFAPEIPALNARVAAEPLL